MLFVISGQNFLLFDSGPNVNRVVVFGTEAALQLLVDNTDWFADGTFKSAPSIFEQLYTVHVNFHGNMVPVIYALLPNKTQATYEQLFGALKQQEPRLQPTTVMIDFEMTAKQAITSVFLQVALAGCYFHLGQSLWRRVQSEGLQQQYQTDATFALVIRHVLALAFVVSDVVSDYDNREFADYLRGIAVNIEMLV